MHRAGQRFFGAFRFDQQPSAHLNQEQSCKRAD